MIGSGDGVGWSKGWGVAGRGRNVIERRGSEGHAHCANISPPFKPTHASQALPAPPPGGAMPPPGGIAPPPRPLSLAPRRRAALRVKLYVVGGDAPPPPLSEAPGALCLGDDGAPLYEVAGPGPEADGGVVLELVEVSFAGGGLIFVLCCLVFVVCSCVYLCVVVCTCVYLCAAACVRFCGDTTKHKHNYKQKQKTNDQTGRAPRPFRPRPRAQLFGQELALPPPRAPFQDVQVSGARVSAKR